MEYTIAKTITDEQIDDILCTAFEGGINYWTPEMIRVKDFKGCTYAHEVITKGGTLVIVDDDGKAHTLTLKKFLKGIELYGNFDFENYDASDADSVVQFALFGKLIYG